MRVFGNLGSGSDWHAVEWVHPVLAGAGKNAADMLLTIEAMELALTQGYTRFTLVTSDGDFTHLAAYLRRRGCYVTGVGEAKTPLRFRAACSHFDELERAPAIQPSTASRATEIEDIDLWIRAIIKRDSKKGEGIKITDLANRMKTEHGITKKSLSSPDWRSYLSKRASLYALDPKSRDAKVRFLPDGFATAID